MTESGGYGDLSFDIDVRSNFVQIVFVYEAWLYLR